MMTMRLPCLLVIIAALMLASCQESPPPGDTWVPELERTSFDYLRDVGYRVKTAVQSGQEQYSQGKEREAMASFTRAEDAVRVLVYYDIPITEARQLVYVASHLHAMGKSKESMAHLTLANEVLETISQHGNDIVSVLLKDPYTMINDLQLIIEDESRSASRKERAERFLKASAKFQELCQVINLMALKADIALSGAHFSD